MRNLERFDGALLHVYGYKEAKITPTASERPAMRERLVIAAGRELQKRGLIDNVVVSGGAMLGRNEPLSELAAEDFERKTNIESKNMYIKSTAPTTTSGELKSLREEARNHGWNNLLSISWGIHKPRVEVLIKKIFKKTKMKLTTLSAEEILTTLPEPRNQERYGRIIEGIHNSESEKKWEAYEKKILPLMKIPFGSQLLDFISRAYRPKAD